MEETLHGRAGDRQRAHDGLRPFSGVQGADSIAHPAPQLPSEGVGEGVPDAFVDGIAVPTHSRRAPDSRGRRTPRPQPKRPWPKQRKRAFVPSDPLPSQEEICENGEAFLTATFGTGWELRVKPSRLEDVVDDPIDHQWVRRRVARLKPMSDGPMRLIPQLVWDLSTALSQPDWWDTWKCVALRCPREWLVQFCGVAMHQSPARRPRGKRSYNREPEDAAVRGLDSRRVRSMLALGVLAWQLAEYDPSDRSYPYVIRGLPYGAWQYLVADWVAYADRDHLRVPASTTLFGTHVTGGRWDLGDVGYIQAWVQAKIATKAQPNGFAAPPGLAGPWRKNKNGDSERFAFVEVRLQIAESNLAPLAVGPFAPPWRKLPPPPATGELDALLDERNRSWYPEAEGAANKSSVSPPAAADDGDVAAACAADAHHGEQEPPYAESSDSSAQTVWYVDEADEAWLSAVVDSDAAALACDSEAISCEQESTSVESAGNSAPPRVGDEISSRPLPVDVWFPAERGKAPLQSDLSDERTVFEDTGLWSRDAAQWLRTRQAGEVLPDSLNTGPGADLVAASTLEPGSHGHSSPKFEAALAAYQAAKARREQARAVRAEPRKRKPPS